MSFQQTHLISLLNQPFEDQFAAQEDPFDDFLNIPDSYTFEDVVAKDVLNPAVETSDRQKNYDELAKLVATSGVDALPKSATSGPNRIAATPTTALAQLNKKSQGTKIAQRPNLVPVVQPAPVAPIPDISGLTPDVLALYTQLLAGVMVDPVAAPGLPPTPQTPVFDTLGYGAVPTALPATPASTVLDPETDKRQRNNAASARFRAKKKLRDQALARTAQESVARLEMLERRCREQEMEIKWLRGITAAHLEKEGKGKQLRQIYEENGVQWVDGLQASLDSTSLSQGARLALTPVSLPPVPELQAPVVLPSSEGSVAEVLKRQLQAAQPRPTKRNRLA